MRIFSKTLLCLSLTTLLVACNDDNDSKQASSPTVEVQPVPFEPVEATIADIHASILSKGATCVDVVQSYLDRIDAYDRQGPELNSINTVNHEGALEAAKALDEYFAQTGQLKGPLHCATVLPKDNIDTYDMPNTGGSVALKNNIPEDDAFIIKRIREAGGIILGKANLDEFAFGYGGSSSIGGQAKNVYDLTKGPGGSSSGTGAAISASLATVGIGTDTGGSIRVPASVQGLVGLRPSLRLVSQDGIIPLAPTQDTAGPLCRKSVDCAVLMDAMVGFDTSPDSNQRSAFDRTALLLTSESTYRSVMRQPETYVATNASLEGKRIGLIRDLYPKANNDGSMSEDTRLMIQAMDQAVEKLRAAGAIVEEITVEDLNTILTRYSSLSSAEFKISLTNYLKTTKIPYQSYDDLLSSGLMIRSFSNYNTNPESPSYIENYERNTTERSPFVRLRLNSALNNLSLDGTPKGLPYDALAYPSITGFAGNLGGSPTTGTNNRLSPFSGFPALSMPAASVEHPTRSQYPMNVNIEFMAREFDEPTLFNIAAAFEKANPARVTPTHTPALNAAVH